MKRVVWIALAVAPIIFILISQDPLNEAVNFIIAGSIPGTEISLGFWSTLGLAFMLFLIIRKGINNARHKMIVVETEKNRAEKAKSDFEEANKIEFDRSKRSVIAARKSESTL